MTPSIHTIVEAAYTAKVRIDDAHDVASLELAFQAVAHLAIVAVQTPYAVQEAASAAKPGMPVLEGLLREAHAATIRIAQGAEKARLALAS